MHPSPSRRTQQGTRLIPIALRHFPDPPAFPLAAARAIAIAIAIAATSIHLQHIVLYTLRAQALKATRAAILGHCRATTHDEETKKVMAMVVW